MIDLKNHNIDFIVNEIKKTLTIDLLKKEYHQQYKNEHYTYGHCYAASEALYYLTGEKDLWIPHQGFCPILGSHWWLVNKVTQKIVDITAEQFYFKNIEPPYSNGNGRGFMQQSNRSKLIIKKVLDNINPQH